MDNYIDFNNPYLKVHMKENFLFKGGKKKKNPLKKKEMFSYGQPGWEIPLWLQAHGR